MWRGPTVWIAVGVFLACHALLPRLFPGHALLVSLCFLVLAPLMAGVACMRHGFASRVQGWWLLAAALTLWAGGMAVNVLALFALANASGETGVSMLLFVLYGVPIIFAIASPRDDAWPVRLVDALLALALGLLFFVHTFAFATMAGTDHAGEASLRLMFDIENLLVAIFALVRLGASRQGPERDFLRALSIYACIYMASAAYMNHMQFDTDYGGPVDLVIDLPFLVLMAVVLGGRQAGEKAGPGQNVGERLILAVSPLMLPAMLLAVSAALLASHPVWAVAGFAMATLVYGLRNVLAHLGNLEERDRLERLAQVDGLTGLPNRRCFDETLAREWARARRSGTGIALLMIDIDHFKLLNDGLGHPEGDRRLRDVARVLSGCTNRASDLVARYGGEEFVAILLGVNAIQAGQMAEIMRASVQRLGLPSPAPMGRVTISIGVGHAAQITDNHSDQLLAVADAALYEAKRDGRNAVRVQMRQEPLQGLG
ncbi:MAG: GGDEF domain-containing protein [Sphingomonadales bacterium]|nr:GGDEF domain-containing protein [Sphingomonadales bacterium]MDE2171021.1 GGDEF domain-containing protein [Sphingomonadales bacterium]